MTAFQKSYLYELENKYKSYCEAGDIWNKYRKSGVERFIRHCLEYSARGQTLTQEMVNSWCRKRDTESNNSCRARIYPAIGFIRFLLERGIIEVTIPDIPDNQPCKYVPHAFTTEELTSFFHACDTIKLRRGTSEEKMRKVILPVIFRFLYSTGMRTQECRLLKLKNIDFETGIIIVEETKSYIQHHVVLHDSMLSILRKYNTIMESLVPDREYLFPGINTSYIDENWLQRNFKNLWDKSSSSRATPYDLRHNYAVTNINSWNCSAVEEFSRLAYLSKSMGHSTIQSTRYYYHFVPRLNDIMEEKSRAANDSVIPEVKYEYFEP